MTAPEGFIFRKPQQGDANFLLSSWLQSSERLYVAPAGMTKTRYYDVFHGVVSKALTSKRVTILALDNRPNVIAGFCVFDPERKAVLQTYVKHDFRRCGLASSMLDAIGFGEGWSIGVIAAPWQTVWRREKGVEFLPFELTLI